MGGQVGVLARSLAEAGALEVAGVVVVEVAVVVVVGFSLELLLQLEERLLAAFSSLLFCNPAETP